MDLHKFTDIHTHNLNAGPQAIINLPLGVAVPSTGYYSVGIHPWETKEATQEHWESIVRNATLPQVVAIGETGLDKLQGAPLEKQIEIFRNHAMLGEELGKPLILHIAKAWNEIIAIKKDIHPKQLWIVHGFRGKPELAQQLLSAGFAISLGPKFNESTAEIIPLDRLYHETD